MDLHSRRIDAFKSAQLMEIHGKTEKTTKTSSLPFRGYLCSFPKIHFNSSFLEITPPSRLSKYLKSENLRQIAAINGGFWDHEKKPLDWNIVNNEIRTPLTNYNRPIIKFHQNSCEIIHPPISAQLPLEYEDTVLQAGPSLIIDSNINLDYGDYKLREDEFDSDITKDRHPRSVFGYDDANYYFLVIDGRSRQSAGLFLEELAEVCKELGLSQAINLDGGASSTLIFQGKRINHPRFSFVGTSRYLSAPVPGMERKIPNAFVILPRS